MCYCLKNSGKIDKGPCGRKCDDEVPECRYCMRYKVLEDPQPKRKTTLCLVFVVISVFCCRQKREIGKTEEVQGKATTTTTAAAQSFQV